MRIRRRDNTIFAERRFGDHRIGGGCHPHVSGMHGILAGLSRFLRGGTGNPLVK